MCACQMPVSTNYKSHEKTNGLKIIKQQGRI